MSRIFMEAHSTSEFKTENRNECTGKEETRCQGGASPYRERLYDGLARSGVWWAGIPSVIKTSSFIP